MRMVSSKRRIYSVVLFLPALLALSWLVMESHGPYGDEVTHLGFLDKALCRASDSANFLETMWAVYRFDPRYPPVFYLLSIPFVYSGLDPILGGRLFVAWLFLLSSAILVALLREFLSSMGTLTGLVVLCSSPIYLLAGRYYLVEILILVWLLSLLLCLVYHVKKGRFRHLVIGALLMAAGLLTKFNFVLYAAPVLISYGIALWWRNKEKPHHWRSLTVAVGVLFLPALILAAPWYVWSFLTQREASALTGLSGLQSTGALIQSTQLFEMVALGIDHWKFYFPIAVNIVFVFFLIIRAAVRILGKGLPAISSIVQESPPTSRIFCFWLPIGFILSVSVALYYLGLGTTFRWNLSYAFFAILVGYFMDSLARPLERVLGPLVVCWLVLVSVNSFVVGFSSSRYLSASVPSRYDMRPNRMATGARGVVELVREDWSKRGFRPQDCVNVGILTHIHEGLHGHNLAYYGKRAGLKAAILNVGILAPERPADTIIFSDSDYLVYLSHYRVNEPVLERYQSIVDRLPNSYRTCLYRVGTVESRYNRVVVERVERNCLTRQALIDIVALGKEVDQDTPVELFWDVERLRIGLEMDSEKVDLLEAEGSLGVLLGKMESRRQSLTPFQYDLLARKWESVKALVATMGSNLDEQALANPGFEYGDGDVPLGWEITGDVRFVGMDTSGLRSHRGRAAVRIAGEKNDCHQIVAIDSQTAYALIQYTNSDMRGQYARLQVNWLDAAKGFLGTNIERYPAKLTWTRHAMIVKPPQRAKYAVVYAAVFGDSEVWFDDFSFRPVD